MWQMLENYNWGGCFSHWKAVWKAEPTWNFCVLPPLLSIQLKSKALPVFRSNKCCQQIRSDCFPFRKSHETLGKSLVFFRKFSITWSFSGSESVRKTLKVLPSLRVSYSSANKEDSFLAKQVDVRDLQEEGWGIGKRHVGTRKAALRPKKRRGWQTTD